MRRSFFVKALGLFLLAGCSAFQQEAPASLRGRLVLEVVPNPIEAVRAGDDLYDLTFDIVMREAGGIRVTIEEFTVDAIAFKTVTVKSETFPASYITDRGYPAEIGAGKYLRFSFKKRWQLPSRLLLSGASARVTARTVDENGRKDVSTIKVGVVVNPSGSSGVHRAPSPRSRGAKGNPTHVTSSTASPADRATPPPSFRR
jgi:hypothetical protein